MSNKLEKQFRSIEDIHVSDEGRTIEGYAIRFNEPSNFMGFIEIIAPEAITQEMIDKSDIYAKFDHRDDAILARYYKPLGINTLSLELREDGLFYSFEAPHTAYGDEVLEHIKRGEIVGSSFGFYLAPNNKGVEFKREDGVSYQIIHDIVGLFDVSPVFRPAYPTSTINTRSQLLDEADAREKLYNSYMEDIDNQVVRASDIVIDMI